MESRHGGKAFGMFVRIHKKLVTAPLVRFLLLKDSQKRQFVKCRMGVGLRIIQGGNVHLPGKVIAPERIKYFRDGLFLTRSENRQIMADIPVDCIAAGRIRADQPELQSKISVAFPHTFAVIPRLIIALQQSPFREAAAEVFGKPSVAGGIG